MSILKGLEWTFNTNAETYAKMRPGYVEELYDDIFKYININSSSVAVEVGIGGGQATLPFLKTGCKLTAVEYGENLAKICREKFKDYTNFSTIVGKFEDTSFASNSCDLVYSASAFHWIPEETGYNKVYDMLKSNGVFARFALHPYRNKENPDLAERIDRVYATYYYKYYKKEPEKQNEYSGKHASDRADIAKKYGFVDISYKLYHRTRTYTAKEYAELQSTNSDHIAIEENTRTKLLNALEDAVNHFGGQITIYDTIDLQLARKP